MAFLTFARAALAIIVTASVCSPFAQISQSAPEHEVKAAFLYNFTKFVTWPPRPGNQPFRVCVVADESTTAAIGSTMQDEIFDGQAAETIVPSSQEQARSCQVLYVGSDGSSRGASLLAAVRATPVLTVGDAADFLERGGIIQFVAEAGRIRFDVNLTHAARAQLSINARMLRVARKVDGRP
jgi:hypothetical protein